MGKIHSCGVCELRFSDADDDTVELHPGCFEQLVRSANRLKEIEDEAERAGFSMDELDEGTGEQNDLAVVFEAAAELFDRPGWYSQKHAMERLSELLT